MSLVQFKYRRSKPVNPVKGSFYWVDLGNKAQIWFSPDGIADNLILLSNEVDDSIVSRIEAAEGNIEEIQRILDTIDLSHLDLTDSDYDIIAERVGEIITPSLQWIRI